MNPSTIVTIRILLIALWGILLSAHATSAQPLTCIRVVDGDTIILSNGETVRLIGVDTPKTEYPGKPGEYFGKEATAFTKRMVEGKEVTLEYGQQQRDKYGRLLAYVYLMDGTLTLNKKGL